MPSDSTTPSSSDSSVGSRQFPSLQPLGSYAHLDPIALHRPITLIGSRRTARIHLNSTNVSRAHAILVVTPDGCVIRDLLSREGTDVDGERITEHRLTPGQVIKIAEFTFRYDDPRELADELRQPEAMALRIKTPKGQKELPLDRVVTLAGKRSGSDIELPFPDVSTANTVIVRMDVPAVQEEAQPGYLLYDLGGKGTQRNGQPVHRGRFRPGDKLQIGPASLRIAPVAAAAPAMEPSGASPAVAERPREPVEPAQTTEPVEDRDEIVLGEGLAEDSGVAVAEDLLGDSHVLEALQEPPAEAEATPEPQPEPEEEQDAALEEALGALDGNEGEVAYRKAAPTQADAADLGLIDEAPAEAEAEGEAQVVDEGADAELEVQDLQGGLEEPDIERAAATTPERDDEESPILDLEELDEVPEATEEAPAPPVPPAPPVEVEDDAEPVVDEIESALPEDEEAAAPPAAVETAPTADPSDDSFEQALAALSDDEQAGAAEPADVISAADEGPEEEEQELSGLSIASEDQGATPDAVAEEEQEDEVLPPIGVADEAVEEAPPVTIAEVSEQEDEAPDTLDLADETAEVPEPSKPAEQETPAFELDLSRTDFSTATAAGEPPAPAAEEAPAEAVDETPVEEAEAPLEVAPRDQRPRRRRKGNRRRLRAADQATAPAPTPEVAPETPVEAESDLEPVGSSEEQSPTTPVMQREAEEDLAEAPLELAEAPLELAEAPADEAPPEDEPAEMEIAEAQIPDAEADRDDGVVAEESEPAAATEPASDEAFSLDTVFDQPAQPDAAAHDVAIPPGAKGSASESISDEQFLASLDALGDESAAPVEPVEPAGIPLDEADAPETEQPPEFIDEPSRSATGKDQPQPLPPQQPEEDWRSEWQRQGSAFIGNVNPLDLRSQPEADAPPKRKEPAPRPEPTPAKNMAPSAEAPDRNVPTAATEPGGDDAGGDVLELSRSPQVHDRPRPAPQRPHRVGFGQPVAEIDEAEAPMAAGPFSSAPVAQARTGARGATAEDPAAASDDDGYYGPLDPSAGMPETSGLTGAADVFSLGQSGPADIPEFGTDPTTGTDEIDTTGTATAVEPSPDGEVDGFLRTIREGVGASSGMTGLTDRNGRGRRGRSSLDDADEPLPEAIGDADGATARAGWRGRRRRNGHAGPLTSEGRRGPAPVPATQLTDDERARAALLADDETGPRRKFIFVPLLFAVAVALMIGAIVAIWIGLAPRTPVAVKLRYDIPPSLDEDDRRAFQQEQLMLLGRPEMRPQVLERLKERSPDVAADFLIDPVAYNRVAMGAYWSPDEPDTLVLERPSVHPEEEMARLKAVAATLYEKSRSDRGLLERSDQTSRQLQREIADLNETIEVLSRNISELAANVPADAADPASVAARETALRQEIARLDELWTSSDRRVAELKLELARIAEQDALANDQQLEALRDRLAEIEQQLGDLTTGDGEPQDDRWQAISTELRARPAALASDATGELSAGEQIAQLAESLLTEMLPAHLKSAAAIEMAREKAERLESEQYDHLLAGDDEAQGILGDIALRQRQLNAARADGIREEIQPLEMALRILRNRLDLRQRSLRVDAANDPAVIAAVQALEEVTRTRTAQMIRERDEVLRTFDSLLAGLAEGDTGDAASLQATAVRAALAAAAFEQARRSPVTAAIWLGADGFNLPGQGGDAELDRAESSSFALVQETATKPAVDPVELQEELARVERAIERREAELRGEIETTTTRLRQELATAEATASKAQREAQEARGELSRLMAGRDTDQAQRQRLAELRAQKAETQGRIEDLKSQLAAVQEQLETLAVPRPPSDADVVRSDVEDNRIQYIIYSMVAIFMLTLASFFMLYRGG